MTRQPLPPTERIDVTSWERLAIEAIGDEPKTWLRAPDGSRHLWKPVTRHDGWEQGEDWAELLVHAVATLLGVPSAPIRLASCRGRNGLVSQDVTPRDPAATDGRGSRWSTYPGTDLLAEIVEGYDRRSGERSGHDLGNIRRVLEAVGPPVDAGCDELSAYDVLCGYLVLDALVAGRDRHSDNWSIAVHTDGDRRLLASYDHASSLAFNRRDSWRRATLLRQGVADWVRKGDAWRFEGGRGVPLVAWAARALRSASATARNRWLEAVGGFDPEPVGKLAAGIPTVSEVGRTFVVSVLSENRRRLLDEL
jgi:hypothetical protein